MRSDGVDVAISVSVTADDHRRTEEMKMSTRPGVSSQLSSADAARAGSSPLAVRHVGCPDDGLSVFMNVRHRLFSIAYGMLGSAAEAEDIVQDVWVRWQTTDRSMVRDAAAFLATTATRLAINVRQSARSRCETYVASWLPEPVDTSADPEVGAERGEALARGVLLLLEKLTATERAAYVLREAFDYTYRQIATIFRLEEANARQVVTRARRHVANGRRMPASSTEQRRFLGAFIAASQIGDVAGLEALFASDIVSASHSRGSVRAAPSNRRTDLIDDSARIPQRVAVVQSLRSFSHSAPQLMHPPFALFRHNTSPYPVNGSYKRASLRTSKRSSAALEER
jgi:RNA polymerase sigma-70 factor (ECF subfamily)